MGKSYILALDEGTTSARTILFDENCTNVYTARREFTQYFPKPAWVEHDPDEIFNAQFATLRECVEKSGVDISLIKAIGITNQRETVVIWNKYTGKPVYNAIVWQCRRSADICEKLIADGYGKIIEQKTGLRPDAYFSATKIMWILDNVEGVRESAERGELLFGTIDTWLVWKLTGGKVHVTDRTNASRTMMYNIRTNSWDKELTQLFGIPESMLPEVASSSEIYGYAEISGRKIAIAGISGDQQSALFGQGCFCAGDVKNTYGTGCFLLMNTGTRPISSKSGLLTTIAATEKGKPVEYVLEGSVFSAGAVIKWMLDELCIIDNPAQTEEYANSVSDNGGVYLVPAFTGLGAPHWDMNARASLFGMTRGTGKAHIARAALESIAYQSNDLIGAMRADSGMILRSMRVDGGVAANNFLMQFQSDISKIPVMRPRNTEATALGAAFLAGLAAGVFRDRDELCEKLGEYREFRPDMPDRDRGVLLDGWNRAVAACRAFTE